jgi:hypothetical protein
MEKKICSKCKVEKDVCEFGIHGSTKDKLRTSCKECRKDEGKLYREHNTEKKKLTIKNWMDKNPNYNQSFYLKNKEKINLNNKNWYELNKEKHRKNNKKWIEKNIDKVREYHNNRIKFQRKTNPLNQLIFNVRTRINSVLKNKIKSSFDIVGCTPEFLKEHIEKQFTKGMTWELVGKHIHIDHIIPLSSAKTEEEVYKLCHYTNLQPLWAEDNLKKGDKILTFLS